MDQPIVQPNQSIDDLLKCFLCNGYLIDCVTTTECRHSFCKSCLVKHFRIIQNDLKCPQCNQGSVLIFGENVQFDHTKQSLLYKIKPHIFQREMAYRRMFYDANPNLRPFSREDRGVSVDHYYLQTDNVQFDVEYGLPNSHAHISNYLKYESSLCKPLTFYYENSVCTTILMLKNLLAETNEIYMIRNLIAQSKLEIHFFYSGVLLDENLELLDIIYRYGYSRAEPLLLKYCYWASDQCQCGQYDLSVIGDYDRLKNWDYCDSLAREFAPDTLPQQ